MKKSKNKYLGWELESFDNANNFRNYQFSIIKKFIKGKIAEVGPGNGSILKLYYKKSKSIYVFEPSRNLFDNLKKIFKKQNKINLINDEFNLKKNYYDAIIYLDVLEHIKNDKIELMKAYKSLKPNGHLIINVPAFQHLYNQFDRDVKHFRRYNKSAIIKITKNLNIVQLKYYDSIGYLLSLSSKIFSSNYKKNFTKKIKIWDSLIFLSKILDKILFNLFGKSLIIVIKKN